MTRLSDVLNGDTDDDVVWSNAAYPLAAVMAQTWPQAVAVGVAGLFLALGSGVFHATYDRWAQRLDVTGVMTYVAAAVAVILAQWTVWAYVLVPLAAMVYWDIAWEMNSFYHVPAWAAVGLTALGIQVGAWVLVPAGLFLCAGIVKVREPDSDSALHSLWHVLSAAAVAGVLWVA